MTMEILSPSTKTEKNTASAKTAFWIILYVLFVAYKGSRPLEFSTSEAFKKGRHLKPLIRPIFFLNEHISNWLIN